MAKLSAIQNNKKKMALVSKFSAKRTALKKITMSKTISLEERFIAQLALAELPRNSAAIRVRNRCEVTGRPRAYYRRFKMSRIALRDLASYGLVPGIKKASW